MLEVVGLLVVPKECQHVLMEKYFEDPASTRTYVPCATKCVYCTRRIGQLTGRIHRQKLTNSLISFCSRGTTETPASLIEHLKVNKELIFHPNDVPGREVRQIHALCIQLVACGIFELSIAEGSWKNIGKTDIGMQSVAVRMSMKKEEPTIMTDSPWEVMNFYT
jgi:hypothetical protein